MAKLVIQNTVKVPVKFSINDNGKEKQFSFGLICERLPQEEINAVMKDDDALTSEIMRRITKGWDGQTLVIEEDNQPAKFDAENFEVMMTVGGFSNIAWKSYLAEVGAKVKNL